MTYVTTLDIVDVYDSNIDRMCAEADRRVQENIDFRYELIASSVKRGFEIVRRSMGQRHRYMKEKFNG